MKEENLKNAKTSDSQMVETWKKRFWLATSILSTIILIIVTVGCVGFLCVKDKIVSDEDIAALAVFDEIAAPFINNIQSRPEDNHITTTKVSGYDISPDGDFNISFNLCERIDTEDGFKYGNCRDGKMYFWWDDEYGRSYGFGFDE